MSRLDVWLVVVMSMAGWLTLTTPARGQTIVPVDQQFAAPMGLSFRGEWSCSDGSSTGLLKVGNPSHISRRNQRPLGRGWTEIEESQEGLIGHYLVGYDRDHSQFVIIDVDDPAYAAYQTDGWRERGLTLAAANHPGLSFPTDRFVYEVNRSDEFTVASESLEGTVWITRSRYTCRKIQSTLTHCNSTKTAP
jgi:hypothetical protein